MNKIFFITLLSVLSIKVAGQEKQPLTNYLKTDLQADYVVEGTINDKAPYTIGVDEKKYYREEDYKKTLKKAAQYISALKDALSNPHTEKKLRIVLMPDGETVTMNLKENDGGKEMAFYQGELVRLKTGYDTLEIIQRKKYSGGKKEKEYLVWYVFRMKDINEFPVLLQKMDMEKEADAVAKSLEKKSFFSAKINSYVEVGIMANNYVPVGPYLGVGYLYLLKKDQEVNADYRTFIGLHISTMLGLRNNVGHGISNFAVEVGGVKYNNDDSYQKLSILAGIQYVNQVRENSKPLFMLGLNFPISNRFSAGFMLGTDFKYENNKAAVNSKTNIGVALKFNF